MTRKLLVPAVSILALMTAACQPPAQDAGNETDASAKAAATAPVQVAGHAVLPDRKSFRDWRAVCDNGNRCMAFHGNESSGWIRIVMEAGPDAIPEISVGLTPFGGSESGRNLSLVIDAQKTPTRADDEHSQAALVPEDRVASVLMALVAARSLSLSQADQSAELSPAGISAALLWIDERQGRLGTTTALIRRGEAVAATVPLTPALPVVTALMPVSQAGLAGATNPSEQGDKANIPLPASIEALAAVKQCREDTSYNEYLQKALLAARLSDTTELWGVPCNAGAYNATYEFYLTGKDGARPRKADFPSWDNQPRQEGDIAGDGLVNPVFDPATNTITHFPRARGLGDCGTIQTWAWTADGFALTEERVMGECWGMGSDLWPTTWRTRS